MFLSDVRTPPFEKMSMVGQSISHYTILEKLGEGGMGVVYKATDTRLGRTVALKFVLSIFSSDTTTHTRLTQEARACAALNHPNITTIYDFEEKEDRKFIVMEYVEGRTLDVLMRERRFNLSEVLDIAEQVAAALGAAHAGGVVHRDLKPSNIMLASSGRVKVMDFGLAKLAESSFMTQAGTTLGTAAYMPPEQVRGDEVTPLADIYALGAVLYELSTGQLPFQQAHQLAVLYSVMNEEPQPPRAIDPSIPEALESVIQKAMQKEPRLRYQSSEELALDLRAARHGTAGVQTELTVKASSNGRGKPFGRSMAGLGRLLQPRFAIPAVAVALIAAFFLFQGSGWFQPNSEPASRALASTHLRNAASHIEAGRPDQAQEELRHAVSVDPSFSDAWNMLAALSAQAGSYESAVEQSKKAISLDPRNSFAYYNLAFAREEMGRVDEAVEDYNQAIELDPNFVEAYSALGNLYVNMNRPLEAIRILDEAIARVPDSEYLFLIYKNLGKAHIAQDDPAGAAAHLQRSLELNPEWPETWSLLARAYEAAGQTDESRTAWERYLQIEPDPQKRREVMERRGEL